jgi:P-type Ca2+ transporter type 2C
MAWTQDWTFLGLAGLMDPPRAEARQAIAQCKAGYPGQDDHRRPQAHRRRHRRELGLTGEVVSGAELDAMAMRN